MVTFETSCPCCGAVVELEIDEGGGHLQEYVEDCPVCCRPWDVEVREDASGEWRATLRATDE
jgi:hypothetical protein